MEIASHETDFFLRLEKMQTPRSVFEKQGKTHAEVDLRLAQAIESLLVPIIGPWEQSAQWFHQLDFYGDGVRSLTFGRTAFPIGQIEQLQQLLRGEHAPFCILCIATDRMSVEATDTEREDDYLAIFASRLLVTKAVAALLGPSS